MSADLQSWEVVAGSASESIPAAPAIVPGTAAPERKRKKSQQDVVSTWQTLPVGARGFHLGIDFQSPVQAVPAYALFKVPAGYVAVLEAYRFDAGDVCTVSVVAGSAVDPYQQRVDVAQFRTAETKVWAIADENTNIGLQFFSQGNNDGNGAEGVAYLRGVLLEKYGSTLALEIAGRVPALPEEIAAEIIKHQRRARAQDAAKMGAKK